MWLLGRMLLLVIGDLVPEEDERWAIFLKMMDNIGILFSRITEDEAPYLAVLISDYHEQFRHLEA